ncbi:MAG TPA: carboxypeptidase-like regulatory domain-containing protein [Candidatus Acidoferrales bacterium]
MPESTSSVSFGEINGHPVFGANYTRAFRGWLVTAGDSQPYFSTGQLGLVFPLRGIYVTRGNKDKTRRLSILAGLTGEAQTTPFLYGTRAANRPSLGVLFTDRLSDSFDFSTIAAFEGGKRTALGEGRYRWKGLKLAGAAGWLSSEFYFDATATYTYGNHFSIVADHQNYRFEGLNASANTASGAASWKFFNGNAGIFESQAGTAETAGLGVTAHGISATVNRFWSKQGAEMTYSATEHINRKFYISEFYGTQRGKSIQFGGGYSGNFVNLSLGYATFYLPLTGRFTNSTVASVTLQLPHSATATLGTNILPTGHVLWNAYGGAYQPLGIGTGNSSIGGVATPAKFKGEVPFGGIVTDDKGRPVEGASVTLGSGKKRSTVYSNAAGAFSAMLPKNTESVEVTVDVLNFAVAGDWVVVNQPKLATPGEVIEVTLHRVK